MSRGAQNLLVLLTGLAVAVIVVKGSYLHYVKPALLPWLIVAAVVLMALGAVSIIRDLRRTGRASAASHEAHPGHNHGGWQAWALLLPVALLAFVVPPPLDAGGATPQQVAAVEPQRRAFPPLPPGPAPTVSVPDLVMRAAADSAHTLDGRTVTVTGFILPGAAGVDLGRVVIICCAADAQLARIRLRGAGAAPATQLAANTWVQVQGTVVPGSSDPKAGFVPTMMVSSVHEVPAPANTYAY